MNCYKEIVVSFFLFAFIQLYAEAKPVVLIMPVTEYINQRDTCKVYTPVSENSHLYKTGIEQEYDLYKKKPKTHKKKKEIFMGISEATEDVIIGVIEVVVVS